MIKTFIYDMTQILSFSNPYLSREGVIIEWLLKDIFHDAGYIILTSRTDVREVVDHVNIHEWPLFSLKCLMDKK